MLLDTQYKLGETVYLVTDTDQCKRLVTGYMIRTNGITYKLSCGVEATWHYDFEISKKKTYANI